MRRLALLALLLSASVTAAAPAPLPKPERKKGPDKVVQTQLPGMTAEVVEMGLERNGQLLILRLNVQQVQNRVRVLRLTQPAIPALPPK